MRRLSHAAALGVACAALAAVGGAGASDARLSPAQRIDAYIRSQVAAREFVGSVLVAREGRVLLARGYGFADRERRIRNSPLTQFRITLATQLFNRIAILQLRDAGRLRTSDSVCVHLSPCPRTWRPITIEALLENRSGLPDVHPLAARVPPLSLAEVTAWLARRPLRSRPLAATPDPSPAAYLLLARVIERVSGESWYPYLRRHILRPAGMSSTVPDELARGRLRAVGYLLPSLRRGRDVSFARPDAAQGLRSTVVDLSRLDKALYRGSILAPSSVAELYPPTEHVVQGEHAWDVGDGWYALTGRHTPDRLLVVLLSNGRKLTYRFYELENRIAAIAAGPKPNRPVAAGPTDIAFVRDDGTLAVAGADGSEPRSLTTVYAGRVYGPAWSPDGSRLAFQRCADRRCAVYVIAADGTGERRLGPGGGATWSPDGRGLAVSAEGGPIWIVSVATGARRRLPTLVRGAAGGLSWSPDGRSILFITGLYGARGSNHNDVRDRLAVIAATGGKPRFVNRTPGFYLTSNAAWSPDSRRITFTRRDRLGAAPGSAGAYVAAADGSAARRLALGAYGPPRFLPDGSAIVFNLGLGCRLRVVPVDGGPARTLPFEACEAVWRPRG